MESTYQGLVEKLRILNNDPVAEALDARLQKLRKVAMNSKSDVLSLLLHLSDKPAEKSRIDDPHMLRPPTPPPPLTWSTILEEQPFDDPRIWKDIDYRTTSSDEGSTHLSDDIVSDEDVPSPVDVARTDHASSADVNSLFIQPKLSTLETIAATATRGRSAASNFEMSEIQLIREVIRALQGLPSELFEDCGDSTTLSPQKGIYIHECSKSAINSVLECFGVIGSNTNLLRKLVGRPTSKPLIQTLLSCIDSSLCDFDGQLSRLEERYVRPNGEVLVSVLELQGEVEALVPFLMRLTMFTTRNIDRVFEESYLLLQFLCEEVSDLQQDGEESVSAQFRAIFSECFKTYLRPVERWMIQGHFEDGIDAFPITAQTQDVSYDSFWHNKFKFRYEQGNIAAPHFFQMWLPRILAAGKHMALIKELNLAEEISKPQDLLESPSQQTSIFCVGDSLTLLPFAESLSMALEVWTSKRSPSKWSILRTHLIYKCGLLQTVDALQIIYLSSDGGLFDALSTVLAEYLESASSRLEPAVRALFYEQPSIKPHAIAVNIDSTTSSKKGMRRFEAICITYSCPWPVANIIQEASLKVYQGVLHLLIQARLALHSLSALRLRPTLTADEHVKHSSLTLYLLHRLKHTLSTILSHVLQNVVHPASRDLSVNLENADSFDGMVQAHLRFVTQLEKGAMLLPTLSTAREALRAICDLAILFCKSAETGDSNAQQSTVSSASSKQRPPFVQMRVQLGQLVDALVANVRSVARDDKDLMAVGWSTLTNDLEWHPRTLGW